ncbi:MAG: glycoside hydrolase family 127 protein, partial [Terrimicrobiaceae bacterium]
MNQPIPFTEVRIDDSFWNERLRINREVSLPYQYWQCKETGRIDAFKLLWQPGTGSAPNIAWDSDVAKWVEAASYSLATHPDAELAAQLEEVVALIASAQQPDGYLNTHFTQVDQEKRWENLQDAHELYCAGHLIEAAVAHFQATGKRDLLDVACRYADYISTVFGREEEKIHGYCGHEEIELALVKLYRATREKRYLELSRYFVEERGQSPHIFKNPRDAWGGLAYYQAHAPVREQKEAVGHAVRAVYLYSAIADLAGESNDPSLLAASETLWESVTKRKMYLTGGIGSTRAGEAFTNDYDLPDETAYCETCAAVGMVMWSHRLVQLDCDRRYADVMERALYNGVLSGVSRDGTKFFYENPLASRGGHHRQPWFECVCCPSNLSRLLASLGNYLFSRTEDGLAVHLYLQSEMTRQSVAGASVQVKVETRYPWEGLIRFTVETDRPADFALRLRIPEWCRSYEVRIGGKKVEAPEEKGYAVIHRTWSSGDAVELVLDMPVEKIVSHPGVLMNQG